MTDPLSPDDGEQTEGKKDDFVGTVVLSQVECDCENCVKGDENADFGYEDDRKTFDHLMKIDPLTVYEDTDGYFHEYSVPISKSFGSKWMVFLGHLNKAHGSDPGFETLEDIAGFLEGRVFELREVSWEEDEEFEYPGVGETINFSELFDGEFEPNNMLLPIKEVTDENELANLGVESSPGETEIEEVELE